ncbi:MAG: histone deacetylase [Chloroflexi bacterium]|nr:histone deacetylase [Chloroflexota bacterium]MCY4246653.1 histone deacetylase [Chloroflexota bacterium]
MTTAYLTHSQFTTHDHPRHPEHAGRIEAVWQQLAAQGLTRRLLSIAPSPASDAQIRAAHTAAHLNRLVDIAMQERRIFIDQDTYALPGSLETARLAAGAVIGAVDAVCGGRAQNGLAIVRPPGHHATAGRQMGFCLLNNIAIAAKQARNQHGLQKTLIVDYDVHHGNGTQDIFYSDPSVMFISIHQSPFYPGSGAFGETGAGPARGTTVNLPIAGGHGDEAYRRLFEEVVSPCSERFAPDMILVSAGFDAHFVDPLASMQLSLAGYDWLARACIALAERLCDGKIIFVMEGGYDLAALAHGWCNVSRALLGIAEISDPYGTAQALETAGQVDSVITEARRVHQL